MASKWIGRIFISMAAIAIAVIHFHYKIFADDTTTWVLLTLAALPWFYLVIEEVSGPGGWRVRFREIENQQQKVFEGRHL